MVLLLKYFDWSGGREELMDWMKEWQNRCEKHNVKYWGLYGPTQVKWNWCLVLEGDDYNHVQSVWDPEPIRTQYVTHVIEQWLHPGSTTMIQHLKEK